MPEKSLSSWLGFGCPHPHPRAGMIEHRRLVFPVDARPAPATGHRLAGRRTRLAGAAPFRLAPADSRTRPAWNLRRARRGAARGIRGRRGRLRNRTGDFYPRMPLRHRGGSPADGATGRRDRRLGGHPMTRQGERARNSLPLDFDGLRPPCPFMNEAHAQWRQTLRQFVDAHVAPSIAEWDALGRFPDALYVTAARAGILGLGFPEALGGHLERADPGDPDHRRGGVAPPRLRRGVRDLATHWIALPLGDRPGRSLAARGGGTAGARRGAADRLRRHRARRWLGRRGTDDARTAGRRSLARRRRQDADLRRASRRLPADGSPYRRRRRSGYLAAADRRRCTGRNASTGPRVWRGTAPATARSSSTTWRFRPRA